MSAVAYRGQLVSGGRLQVPAEIRRELQLADGDTVKMRVVDGELRIRSSRNWLERVRRDLARDIPGDALLSDELIADRRAEADRE